MPKKQTAGNVPDSGKRWIRLNGGFVFSKRFNRSERRRIDSADTSVGTLPRVPFNVSGYRSEGVLEMKIITIIIRSTTGKWSLDNSSYNIFIYIYIVTQSFCPVWIPLNARYLSRRGWKTIVRRPLRKSVNIRWIYKLKPVNKHEYVLHVPPTVKKNHQRSADYVSCALPKLTGKAVKCRRTGGFRCDKGADNVKGMFVDRKKPHVRTARRTRRSEVRVE